MTRYAPEARVAAVKCLSCAAPTTETVDGSFVCVECGRTVVRRRTDRDGSGQSTRHGGGPVTDGGEDASARTNGGTNVNAPTTDGGVLEPADSSTAIARSAPAVGLIATGDGSDAVIRTIARAVDRGHDVFLTFGSVPDPELDHLARSLGATVVDPPGDRDEESLRATLETAARERSLPGVIVHTEPFQRIDYERSVEALGSAGYVVDAVPASTDETPAVLTAIPARNEADMIADIVETAARYSDVVLVIDDGSDDGTADRAAAAGATVVSHPRNLGYGAALKTAFREARSRSAEHVVIVDGDGQHDPTDIPKLLSAMEERDADVVIGSRFVEGSESAVPRYRRFGISVINLLLNLSVGALRPSAFIRDTQSGFRVYRSDVVETLVDSPGISDDMEASVDILYHAFVNGYRIEEVGTTIDYSVESPNSRHPLAHGYGIVKALVQTIERDRPLTTLGLPGLLSLAAGLGLIISLLTTAGSSSTGPAVAIGAAVLVAFGVVASLAAAVLHGFKLNRHYLDR